MKCNYEKVRNLSESYINGNKSYVRDKVKRINKVEFALLCSEIQSLTNNQDSYRIDEIAFKLIL